MVIHNGDNGMQVYPIRWQNVRNTKLKYENTYCNLWIFLGNTLISETEPGCIEYGDGCCGAVTIDNVIRKNLLRTEFAENKVLFDAIFWIRFLDEPVNVEYGFMWDVYTGWRYKLMVWTYTAIAFHNKWLIQMFDKSWIECNTINCVQ